MSIEAMKQAIDALNEAVAFREGGRQKAIDAINALRTAIQQAEKSEPVAWGWAIVDNKGLERRTRARIQDFFGSKQEAKPFSLEDVAREDREFAGCAPHHVITLFTHPSPGVPEGQAPSVWNSIQIASWIGSQLMREPSMFERNAVCKFVRSLGRHPTLLKHSPKDTHPSPGVPDWEACQRIAETPEVDEALRLFAEGETTEDQAVAIVQEVLTAAQAKKEDE